jgi:hypothetical protein
MTISYQKINLVVFIVLSIANEEARGRTAAEVPLATAAGPGWANGFEQEVVAAACPVKYTPSGTNMFPLLFGGVEDSCNTGCQPRVGSVW